jgi:sortase A
VTDLAVRRPTQLPREWWRVVASGLGQLLITAGVVILLFVGYELWFTGIYTQQQQQQLEHTFATKPLPGGVDVSQLKVDTIPVGTGIAVLYIPRFGRHYHFVIVEGTSFDDLRKGPGHFVGSAFPGQVGNFYVAGHRTTYLHPFNHIDELRDGDAIVLETQKMWFTYRIENIPGTTIPWKEIVAPTAIQVAYPVPDQPDPHKTPTLKLLTFTSCNPKYSAAQRYTIHALLVDARPRSAGLPPALLAEQGR